MKIILFRHGEKEHIDSKFVFHKKSVHLTTLGVSQIEKLAHILAKRFPQLKSLPIIYSSLFTRSIQSAKIVKSILDIGKIIQVPEFGEFSAYNNYDNSKDIRNYLEQTALQNPNWVSPETNISLNQAISIFESKLKEVCQNSIDDLVLISTHGKIIRSTVYSIESKYRPNDELIGSSKIHEAGYTILNFDGQNFSVNQFDVHDYL